MAVLARRELGAPAGPGLAAVLAKASGNPLWVVAMLRSLADEGMLRRDGDVVEVTTPELPESLSDLVVRRLRHLPAATLELLQVTAVLGDAVTIADLAVVAHRPPAAVVAQLTSAFEARLLDKRDDNVVFRHQLVHDAVYQHMPAAVRRLLHREAAAALADAGTDLLHAADHLLLGAEYGDVQAVQWMREAAREAAGWAPSVSVELLRRAEALLPDGHHDADQVSAELVHALLRAGRLTEAADRAKAVLGRQLPAQADTRLRLALLSALALQHRAAEVITVAESMLAALPRLRPADQALVLAQESWARILSGDLCGGETAAGRALAAAELSRDGTMMLWALTTLSLAVRRQGRYSAGLAHCRRAHELTAQFAANVLPLHPTFFLGLALYDCDLIGEARAAYADAIEDELGSVWWHADILMAGAQSAFETGDWDDAVAALVSGGQVAQEKGDGFLVRQSLAYQTVIATAKGDLRRAGELVAPVADALAADPRSYGAEFFACAVAGLAAAKGDLQGGYDILLRSWRFDAESENRYYYRFLAPDLVRLAVALGHQDVAREVADGTETAAVLAPEVPTVCSVARRCRGLVEDAAEPLIEAVELARGVPRMMQHAGACEDAATVLARNGRPDDAARLLAEALSRYEVVGADAWAARVRAGLRALGVQPVMRDSRPRAARGWESLTATERVISQLIAEGLTNRAVARRLHISPHAVNTHLRHVFAKLAVSNRAALASAVAHSIE